MGDPIVIRNEEFHNFTFLVEENENQYSYLIWKEWTNNVMMAGMDFTERLKVKPLESKDVNFLPKWMEMA
jgi:hypothetical protein